MKPLNKAGFTIIEIMLFLGVSGLLIMGLMMGIGTSINVQRYKDSVKSLQSFLQQQFSDVNNVTNENEKINNKCGNDPTAFNRGQSNCVILGKFIKPNDSGQTLEIRTVTAVDRVVTSADDMTALHGYTLYIPSISSYDYDIEWGSSIVKTSPGGQAKFAILMLRSPISGVTRTFINNSSSDVTPGELLDDTESLKRQVELCVNSNGLFTGNTMSVLVKPNATNSSSIKVLGDDNGC
ncbi:MAG: hypothetical protein WCK26_00500 [Candidatus Saccharibacteria bacterium]